MSNLIAKIAMSAAILGAPAGMLGSGAVDYITRNYGEISESEANIYKSIPLFTGIGFTVLSTCALVIDGKRR